MTNAELTAALPTWGFDALAAGYGIFQARCLAAPAGSRSSALWMNRRELVVAELDRRGSAAGVSIVVRRMSDGGYAVGYPSHFEPIPAGR